MSASPNVMRYLMETAVAVATESLDVGHVVQFYGHDEELAGRVADYLLGALDGGGVAIVIATAAHRRAFEARLTAAGADLAAAAQGGTYLALDAGETMRGFVTEGRIDAGAFERVIGGLITRAGEKGSAEAGGSRPVRAYGEMVALLWDAGLVDAAIRLEEMWDSLGRRCSFSLFCGYPVGSVIRDGQLDAFAEVCRLHSEVIGISPAVVTALSVPGAMRAFALSSDAPAAARHFAVGALRRLDAADLAGDAALVVTELAANAVIHAQSGFTVDLSLYRDVLRISVRDGGPWPPVDGVAVLPAAPLHGLGAVAALASRWGVEPLGREGKTVWVELRRAAGWQADRPVGPGGRVTPPTRSR
jgi:MEDS: MEthanogen/methylotroph, DcmR Sensory domain